MATAEALMTAEEMLALPGDLDRWLIDGELRERPMTVRNRLHSHAFVRVARFLDCWRDTLPRKGRVVGGEAGVRLRRNPDTLVGIDVAYIAPEVWEKQPADTTTIDGVPTLAVEIGSPSDTLEDLEEKVDAYLRAGVPLVWIVNPYRKTVTIYRPDAEPEFVNARQELNGDPHLPGLRIPVRELFE